jgi:putative chitinase
LKPFASGPLAKFKTDLEPEDPTHAETLVGAAQVTAWYWNHHKLNAICDRLTKVGNQEAALLSLSIAINGKNKKTGLPNGWDHRKRYFKAAKHALGIH